MAADRPSRPDGAPPSSAGVAFDHVVFDLDGTLVDSRADLAAAVNHALATVARPAIDAETVAGFVGDGARTLIARALDGADERLIDAGLRHFLGYYAAHLLDATRPYPGTKSMLATLVAGGVTISVLSNKPRDLSSAILEGLGLRGYFRAVLGGDSLATRKPDPAGIERLRALTATPRARMLLVGDSAVDAATARNAGVAFCGVSWGFGPARLAAERPPRIVASPRDLVTLVLGAGDAIERPS